MKTSFSLMTKCVFRSRIKCFFSHILTEMWSYSRQYLIKYQLHFKLSYNVEQKRMSICKELHFFFNSQKANYRTIGRKISIERCYSGIYLLLYISTIAVLYVAYFVIPNGVVTKRLHFSCFFYFLMNFFFLIINERNFSSLHVIKYLSNLGVSF